MCWNCLSLHLDFSILLVYNVFNGKKNHKEQTANRNNHAGDARDTTRLQEENK